MTTSAPAGQNGLTGHRLVALRVRRYLQALRWLIGSLFRFKPFRTSTIIGLIAVGRTMQAAAFSLIVWYFLAIEKNAPISYLGDTIEPRSGETMAAAIFGVTAVLIAATFVIFVSARLAFKLAMDFAEKIIKDILNLEGAWPPRPHIVRNGLISAQAQRVIKAKIHLFRPVNVLLMLPRALLLALPAIGGMIWIAGEVVAFLAVLAVPAVALNYMISRSVVVAQRERKVSQRLYRAEERATIAALGDEAAAVPERGGLAERLIEGKNNRDTVRAFSVRILSLAKSEFVANVLAAVAVASIGVYLGDKAINGEMPLALVVAFFVLLRLAVNGLTSVAVSLTTYARFYEVVRNGYEYLTSPVPRPDKVNGRPALHVPAGADPVPGALDDDVPVARGVPVAVISPATLNRYTQYFHVLALTQKLRQAARSRLNAAALRCTAALTEPENLKQQGLLALDQAELTKRIAGTPIAELAPDAGTIQAAAKDPSAVSGADRARIALLAAVLSPAELIIMDPDLLATLPEKARGAWLESLSGRFLAVAYRLDAFHGCRLGEIHAVFMDYERAVAVVKAEDAVKAAPVVAAGLKAAKDEEPDEDDLEEEGQV